VLISCPHCNFSKEIADEEISPSGARARCTRCQTQFDVMPAQRKQHRVRSIVTLVMLGAVVWAALFLMTRDWALDTNYFLVPGVWQGEMLYLGKKHPFELVIEKAQDGRLSGYMDWVESNPRYRLAIRGTYEGNHLVFEDYAFLERKGTAGLNDVQDVYIKANEMSGSAKNGTATLHALKRESAPF